MIDPNNIPNGTCDSGLKSCVDEHELDAESCTETKISTRLEVHRPTDNDDHTNSRLAINIDNFDKIFLRYRSELKNHAARIVSSSVVAEDIVHDVFTKTYQLVSDGKEIEGVKVGGWLFRCVHNEALNVLRKRKRSPHVLLEEDDCYTSELGELDDKFFFGERSKQIISKISDLPVKQRRAFLLFDVYGLSYKEAAAEMDISTNCIRQLLFRARRNIRSLVGPENYGMIAPILGANIVVYKKKASFGNFLAGKISGFTAKNLNWLNYASERVTSLSTSVVAVVLIGVAVVVSQSQNQDTASGAALDPAQLMQSIHSSPIDGIDLLQRSKPLRGAQLQSQLLDNSPVNERPLGHRNVLSPKMRGKLTCHHCKTNDLHPGIDKSLYRKRISQRLGNSERDLNIIRKWHSVKPDYRKYKWGKRKEKVVSKIEDSDSGRKDSGNSGGGNSEGHANPGRQKNSDRTIDVPAKDEGSGSGSVTTPIRPSDPEPKSPHTERPSNPTLPSDSNRNNAVESGTSSNYSLRTARNADA